MIVFSPDRVGRLRPVLWIVVALGVLVLVLALPAVLSEEHREAGVAALAVAAVLLASSGTALRLLPDAERPAKVAAVTTGVVCIVSGLLSGGWIALLLLPVGVGLVFLAVVPDETQAGR